MSAHYRSPTQSFRPPSSTDLKTQLAAKLPNMLNTALHAYEEMASQAIKEKNDDKAFRNNQAASKAALSHIVTLIKLAEMVLPRTEQDGLNHNDLSLLLKAAKAATEMDTATDGAPDRSPGKVDEGAENP